MKYLQEYDHPSQARCHRFAVDAMLREYGFRILSRPKKGEAVWLWCGNEISHSQAIRNIDRKDLTRARRLENDYRESL